jgi:hypothetical protein
MSRAAHPTRRWSWLSVVAEPLAMTVATFWMIAAYSVVLRPPETNVADFYTFWDSAHWFRDGADPYLAHNLRYGLGYNLNPPAAVLIFLPFSFIPLVPAFVMWTTMSVALFIYSSWRVATALEFRRWVLVVCAVLISQTVFSALQLGQLTAVLTLLFTEAWIADRQGRLLKSGLLLGLVIGLKPFLALFAAYAIWRHSRALMLGVAIGFVTVWLTGWLLMGLAGYRSWFEVLRRITWTAHLSNASLLAMSERLFTAQDALRVTPLVLHEGWVYPLWWALAAITLVIGILVIKRDAQTDRAWLTIVLGSLLISPLGWAYYAPLASGPLIGYFRHATSPARWIAAVGYAFLCVPYTIMNGSYGVLLSLLVASASTWGVLSFYLAAMVARGATRE